MIEAAAVRLDRYRQLREVGERLHHAVMELLPREALRECGERLGIWKRNTFVLESEDELCVLMDHCIYGYRWEGKNAVVRYIAETRPRPGTDEALLRDAMLKAHYSVFEIDEVHRGVGMRIRDLFFEGDDRFLVDISMSQTTWEGMLIATRVKAVAGEGDWMTTGAALPVDETAAKRIFQEVPSNSARPLSGCLPTGRGSLEDWSFGFCSKSTHPPASGTTSRPCKRICRPRRKPAETIPVRAGAAGSTSAAAGRDGKRRPWRKRGRPGPGRWSRCPT